MSLRDFVKAPNMPGNTRRSADSLTATLNERDIDLVAEEERNVKALARYLKAKSI